MVYPVEEGVEEVSYYKDDDVDQYKDPTWFTAGSDWLAVTPWGLRSILSWVGSHYPGLDIYITENGVSDRVIIMIIESLFIHFECNAMVARESG